jgi:hypothetical protein
MPLNKMKGDVEIMFSSANHKFSMCANCRDVTLRMAYSVKSSFFILHMNISFEFVL